LLRKTVSLSLRTHLLTMERSQKHLRNHPLPLFTSIAAAILCAAAMTTAATAAPVAFDSAAALVADVSAVDDNAPPDKQPASAPAVSVSVSSEPGATLIDQTAATADAEWYWLNTDVGGAVYPLMALDASGRLAFFRPDVPGEPVIIIDPAAENPGIWIAGQKVSLENAADNVTTSTIVQAAAVVGNYSAGGGNATGDYAVAIGTSTAASGLQSIACGAWSIAQNSFSIALGTGAKALQADAIAVGRDSSAIDLYGIGIGKGAQAIGASSVAIGLLSKGSDKFAIAVGDNSEAAYYGLAIGMNAKATGGFSSMAIGHYSSSIANSSLAIGESANAANNSAISVGTYSSATAANSVAIGSCAYAKKERQVALGTCNNPDDSSGTLFTLGNGTADAARSNAIAVTQEGKTTLILKAYIAPVIPTPAPPNEALEIKGSARVQGVLYVQPAGDVEMGGFTTN
jgi:hypothetical protein